MLESSAAIESAPRSGSAFELRPEQLEVLDAADRYGREELYPLARRMDDEEWWPAEAFARLGQEGYLGITIPAAYGGAGLDLMSTGLVAQAFSRWNHALGLSWIAHDNLCCNNLYRHGSEAQRRRYLPGLCSGKLLGALALTEPGAGSDALGSMRMSARREGDHYLLNGTKIFITNGPVADVLVSRRIFRASAWRRSSPRWAIAAARPVSWCSTTAGSRSRTGSAPRTPVSPWS
jgi:isovaleryl-CoA dehydrogenase